MRKGQSGLAECLTPAVPGMAQAASLPGGISQADCDGDFDPLADAGPGELWFACQPSQQERIASDFAMTRADDVRDALLDTQDAKRPQGAADHRAAAMGRALWRVWIAYRDRALGDLHRRGRITAREDL